MDITEAESGMMQLRREPADLCQIAHEAVELYEYVAEEKRISLQLKSAPAGSGAPTPWPPAAAAQSTALAACPVIAAVDRTRMRQVFANLLDNAIKYTPDGGRVIVEVRNEPNQAVAVFRDTGIGIPAEEQNKIWTRLYRGDKSRSQRGLGLGLSLVKAVVEAHGGTVHVSSKLNEGSEFTVRLPRAAPGRATEVHTGVPARV